MDSSRSDDTAESRFKKKALEALKIHEEANRTNSDYLRLEAAGRHDDLLYDSQCSLEWRAILQMSKATLDLTNWQKHVTDSLDGWDASGRSNSGDSWKILTGWLVNVANMVTGKDDHLIMYPIGPNHLPMLPDPLLSYSEEHVGNLIDTSQASSIATSPIDTAFSFDGPTDIASSRTTSVSGSCANRCDARSSSQDCGANTVVADCELIQESFARLNVPILDRPVLDASTILETRQMRRETAMHHGYMLDQWNQPMRMARQVDKNTSPTYVEQLAVSSRTISHDNLAVAWKSLTELKEHDRDRVERKESEDSSVV